jgi:hypothetical protein
VEVQKRLSVLLLLGLVGCASVKAPSFGDRTWAGHEKQRLDAQLRLASSQLPEGWLYKTEQSNAAGSFAYRKRSGSYDYSEAGHFVVDPQWQEERSYIGLLKPGGVFCVANPERQSSEEDDADGDTITITYWTVYDYCVQLHSQ